MCHAPDESSVERGGDGKRAVDIPIQHQGQVKDSSLPIINKEMPPTIHSSELRLRVAKEENIHQIGNMMEQIAVGQWEELQGQWSHMDTVVEDEEAELERLRTKWYKATEDIMRPSPEELPLFREVDHKIPLINEQKVYKYHLLRCAESIKTELLAKINRYVKAGWWKPATVP